MFDFKINIPLKSKMTQKSGTSHNFGTDFQFSIYGGMFKIIVLLLKIYSDTSCIKELHKFLKISESCYKRILQTEQRILLS